MTMTMTMAMATATTRQITVTHGTLYTSNIIFSNALLCKYENIHYEMGITALQFNDIMFNWFFCLGIFVFAKEKIKTNLVLDKIIFYILIIY